MLKMNPSFDIPPVVCLLDRGFLFIQNGLVYVNASCLDYNLVCIEKNLCKFKRSKGICDYNEAAVFRGSILPRVIFPI